MSETTQQSSKSPERAPEPTATQPEHRKPRNKGYWKYVGIGGGLIVALAAYAGAAKVAYDESAKDVQGSMDEEINYLGRICSDKTPMLPSNLHYTVRAGTPITSTPRRFAESKLIFNLKGNHISTVPDGQESVIDDPFIYQDGNNHTWAGFQPIKGDQRVITMADKALCDSTVAERTKIALRMNWVNITEGERNNLITRTPGFVSPTIGRVAVDSGNLFSDNGNQIAVGREFPVDTMDYFEQYISPAPQVSGK